MMEVEELVQHEKLGDELCAQPVYQLPSDCLFGVRRLVCVGDGKRASTAGVTRRIL